MAQHVTEEEQLETLKRWWSDNGRSVVIGVVVAVVGYFGWQGWQSQQQSEREAASVVYQDLMDVVATGGQVNDEQRERAQGLVEQLKSEYGDLLYASNAALLMAKVWAEAGDLEQAEAQLRWVLDAGASEDIAQLARLRLARVLNGQAEYDQALSVLDRVDPGSYAANYAELRGDVLAAQDRPDEARAAYQDALEVLLPEQEQQRNIIQMKLDNIQVSAATDNGSNGNG